ncbi:hypothetical protein OH807_32725 [Kitasatospora sp. NBC_01560]
MAAVAGPADGGAVLERVALERVALERVALERVVLGRVPYRGAR